MVQQNQLASTLTRTKSVPAQPPLRNPSFKQVKKQYPRPVFGSGNRFYGGPSSALETPSPAVYAPLVKSASGVKFGKGSRFTRDTRGLVTPSASALNPLVIGDGRTNRNKSGVFGKSSRFYTPGANRQVPGPGQHAAEKYNSIEKGAPSNKFGSNQRFEKRNPRVRPTTEYKFNPGSLSSITNGSLDVNKSAKFGRANRFSMYGHTPGKLPHDSVPGPSYDASIAFKHK